tara:strand:- start:182 stop:484 length:303 start_codon:yes stop_codon:yes gene_type:complete
MKNIITNIVILALIVIGSIVTGIIVNKYVIEKSFDLITINSGQNTVMLVSKLLETTKKYMLAYCSLILTTFVVQIISLFLVYNYYVQLREQNYNTNKGCV